MKIGKKKQFKTVGKFTVFFGSFCLLCLLLLFFSFRFKLGQICKQTEMKLGKFWRER